MFMPVAQVRFLFPRNMEFVECCKLPMFKYTLMPTSNGKFLLIACLEMSITFA